MADSNGPDENENDVLYTSEGCELIVIREEDTEPGKPSERFRKWMEEKWGRKSPQPPTDNNGEQPKQDKP